MTMDVDLLDTPIEDVGAEPEQVVYGLAYHALIAGYGGG